ncbi:DUF3558 domain-containing protein [Saccharopolyspora rosea]|uniref:DUF3558 domain-containing protein n=1 Tax=Saccharopolyspora rosea TaxID=524884 RepID=A0ABW3FR08_9PSEU|nr:DUF3558 domain-containing protein [Saccharopolyspora rosea]
MTAHTTRVLAASAALMAFGLASCTASVSGTPQPSSAPPPSLVPSPAGKSDPLHIEHPKKLAAFSDPCQLLSPEQLAQLNAGQAAAAQSEWGQAACKWRNQLFTLKVSPDTLQQQGLRWVAMTAGAGGKPDVEVSGYPAVHYGISSGSCGTYVGTSDKELFLVYFQTGSEGQGKPEYADPCAVADRIAGMVLENLPPA